ncbi:LexA family protein [Leclercia sp. LSNIH1]|uniref:LexA family protein n=1 Tax=Leclercia sp. LSNIH1 TaxID=1920114 RepID=UPI000CD01B3E|nr:S24 family peptidase [Leclercia sp. LSNIH1]AUU85065.1 DNA-binding protein [Leclercia sp. LSNIH1]POV31877.1 DNA-binding protein [Leclercia sp. LSNIH5]POW60340.1 DNA-binding protein [Leclercia sp. LSNIH2]
MGTLGTRLKELRKQRKLTQGQLGKALGVSDVTIGYWERDLNVPGGKSLTKLAQYLGVTEGFLLYGREDEANVGPAPVAAQQIPIISYVQAGAWSPECDARNLDGTVEYILTSEFHSYSTFALKVKGKSMEPDFVEGDVIIIDPELRPGPGDFVVAKNGGDEATFKKYRARGISETGEEIFELVPLNEDYAIRNSAKEKIHVVGVVVEHRRMMRRK